MFRTVCFAMLPAMGRSFMATSPVRTVVSASSIRALFVAAKDEEQELQKRTVEAWLELQQKGKELEQKPSHESALSLAEDVLQMALAYTHSKELIEESHLDSAKAALEKAVSEEKALELAEMEAHQEIIDAELYLKDHEQSPWKGDYEKRRQSVVTDISHRVENYVESRLAEAHEAEEAARRAQEEARQHVEDLQRREAELKATLDELQRFKLREETSQ